jgi:hypothetical protein
MEKTSKAKIKRVIIIMKFNPADPEDISFQLHRAVKQSGLTHQQIVDRLEEKYGEKISVSGLSHNIWRGTIRLQRALQILDADRKN